MKQPTLLVVDVQNEFCHPNGFFARNLCDCNPEGFFAEGKLTSQAIDEAVKNIDKAVLHFRNSGNPIVYIKAVSDPEYLSPSRFDRYRDMYEKGFLKDGTWSTDTYEKLMMKQRPEDRVFKKGGYDPFVNEDFKDYVQENSSSLVLTGFFSDVCIDAVARTSDQLGIGIPTEVIANCSASLYRPHNENLRFMEMFYGTKIWDSVSEFSNRSEPKGQSP